MDVKVQSLLFISEKFSFFAVLLCHLWLNFVHNGIQTHTHTSAGKHLTENHVFIPVFVAAPRQIKRRPECENREILFYYVYIFL